MTFRKNWKIKSFNSRSRKEIDISYCPRRAGLLLFQLTTSRRGRLGPSRKRPSVLIFQLTTSRRGRRRSENPKALAIAPFQLTTSRRGRQALKKLPVLDRHFNSRPREEVDISNLKKAILTNTFQLTTSRGGRH